jgi:DNA-binding GntR family transcriptional regulator
MAEIVSVLALAHAPGATGWLDKAPKHEQDALLAGYAAMGKALRAAKPDVIVGIANDHLLNFCATLHDLSDRYRRLFLEDHPIDRDVAQEHREIADATLQRRADDACALLREHIERTGRLVRGALSTKAKGGVSP